MPYKFVEPHENWTKKHGKVYCQICNDKAKKALVPTAKTSVVFRREHACCEDCVHKMADKVDRYLRINYSESDSEAAFQIHSKYGIEI